ncbi:MAG: SPOR domain-containing protein [Thermoanaerobaculia bacterium]
MAEHPVPDDSSHYEISLTAGQAFIAFILLLGSLGAAFAFGVLVGRGRLDERLVVQREPVIVEEAGVPPADSRIVELGVDDDFTVTDTATTAPPPPILGAPVTETIPPIVEQRPAEPAPPADTTGPALAQVLSSTEARAAENLAAKLIDSGFPTAYVERVQTDQGMIYRVRVRFDSEAEARAAADRLRAITGTDVWITR